MSPHFRLSSSDSDFAVAALDNCERKPRCAGDQGELET
jgi:hypothetical protein